MREKLIELENELDLVARWVEQRCVIDAASVSTVAELELDYVDWAAAENQVSMNKASENWTTLKRSSAQKGGCCFGNLLAGHRVVSVSKYHPYGRYDCFLLYQKIGAVFWKYERKLSCGLDHNIQVIVHLIRKRHLPVACHK